MLLYQIKGTGTFIAHQLPSPLSCRLEISESIQKKPRAIINNVFTTDKKYCPKPSGKTWIFAVFSLCQHRDKHSPYLKMLRELGGRRGLHENFLILLYINERSSTHSQRYIQCLTLVFSKRLYHNYSLENRT